MLQNEARTLLLGGGHSLSVTGTSKFAQRPLHSRSAAGATVTSPVSRSRAWPAPPSFLPVRRHALLLPTQPGVDVFSEEVQVTQDVRWWHDCAVCIADNLSTLQKINDMIAKHAVKAFDGVGEDGYGVEVEEADGDNPMVIILAATILVTAGVHVVHAILQPYLQEQGMESTHLHAETSDVIPPTFWGGNPDHHKWVASFKQCMHLVVTYGLSSTGVYKYTYVSEDATFTNGSDSVSMLSIFIIIRRFYMSTDMISTPPSAEAAAAAVHYLRV